VFVDLVCGPVNLSLEGRTCHLSEYNNSKSSYAHLQISVEKIVPHVFFDAGARIIHTSWYVGTPIFPGNYGPAARF